MSTCTELSEHGILIDATGRAGQTFIVDFLADTAYPPVLDSSVTTVDVK